MIDAARLANISSVRRDRTLIVRRSILLPGEMAAAKRNVPVIEAGCHAFGGPVAERASREVINLPTHRRVRQRDIDKTLGFVENVCRPAAAS